MMAMGAVLRDMTGPITPATITARVKAMPLMQLPLSGGRTWRCDGKAEPLFPSVCTRGVLKTTLNSSGLPVAYQPVG
jgi:branched-chain amino acid transport system substrate-binding protein